MFEKKLFSITPLYNIKADEKSLAVIVALQLELN
jgi:hypothetical protein